VTGQPTDDWSLKEFVDPDSGERTIIRKALALPVAPGDTRYSHVVYFTFTFDPRDSSGLPADEDYDELARIEEQEIPRLETDGLGVLVAVVLTKGVKDFLFYTGKPDEFLREAARIRDSQRRFRLGCEIGPDARWSHYKDLP